MLLRSLTIVVVLLLAKTAPAQAVRWEEPDMSVDLTELVVRDLLCRLNLTGSPVALTLFGAADPQALRTRLLDLPLEIQAPAEVPSLQETESKAGPHDEALHQPAPYVELAVGPIERQSPRDTVVHFHCFPDGPIYSNAPARGWANVRTYISGAVSLLPPTVCSHPCQ